MIAVKLLRICSAVGFLGHGILMFAVFLIADRVQAGSAYPIYDYFTVIIAPSIYLGICFLSTFEFLHGRKLLLIGGLAHLLILPTVIEALRAGAVPIVVGVAIYAALWMSAFWARNRKQREACPLSAV